MKKKLDSKKQLPEEMSGSRRNTKSREQLEKEIFQFLNDSCTKEGKGKKPG
jgi:hypothetical protein